MRHPGFKKGCLMHSELNFTHCIVGLHHTLQSLIPGVLLWKTDVSDLHPVPDRMNHLSRLEHIIR